MEKHFMKLKRNLSRTFLRGIRPSQKGLFNIRLSQQASCPRQIRPPAEAVGYSGKVRDLFSITLLTITLFGLFFTLGSVKALDNVTNSGEEGPDSKIRCCLTVNYFKGSFLGVYHEGDNFYDSNGCRRRTEMKQCDYDKKTVSDKAWGEWITTGVEEKQYEMNVSCAIEIGHAMPCFNELMKAKNLISCETRDIRTCEQGEKYCFWSTKNECLARFDGYICDQLGKVDCGKDGACLWDGDSCLSFIDKFLYETYGKRNVGEFLPQCASMGNCDSINDILIVPLKFAKEIFKYVGALAFLFFIVGGGFMVLSFGNAEKFKKGQGILVAATIGLVIVFSGYFLVGFVLKLIGLDSSFNIF